MPQFSYKTRDGNGEVSTGTMVADTVDAAGVSLHGQGKFVVSLEEVFGKAKEEWKPKTGRQSIKRTDVITFAHQLSVMVDTGVSISEALQCCADQSDSQGFRAVLQKVADSVRAGGDLSSCLSEHPKVFPPVMCSLIKASEVSGTMGTMLDRISTYMSKEAATLRKIRGALTYPAVMLAFVLVITTGLLIFVLPRFAAIYSGRGASLPAPTRLLMGISDSIQHQWYLYLAGAIAIATFISLGFVTQTGRDVVDWIKLNAPVVGSIFRKLYVTRATRTMGTMIDAGVPILDMVPIVRAVTPNKYFNELWDVVDEQLRGGSQLSTPLFETDLIPRSVSQMIFAGEKSGRLGQVLAKVAAFTEEEFDEQVKNATKYIEPIMVVVMGATVGFVAIALLLPIFSVSSVMSG